jgi:tetratricopeptide (TPR) repeat protein
MEFDAAVSTTFEDRENKFVSVMWDFAKQYAPQMRTENVKLAVEHLDAELENFLAALDLIHHMPEESRPLGQLLLALEHYFDTRGLWKLILDYSLTIVEYHTREGGSFPGELYNTIGNAYNALGDYEQAIQYYTMILPNLEANPDFEGMLTVHYSNIGLAYRKMGELEEAEKYP